MTNRFYFWIFLLLQTSCVTPSTRMDPEEQNKFEEKLSILEPFFDTENQYNYLYHFSKGGPYTPYQFPLKQDQDDFSFYVLGFYYDYSCNKRSVFLQVPAKKLYDRYDKKVFEVKKIGGRYVYFSKNMNTSSITLPEIEFPQVKPIPVYQETLIPTYRQLQVNAAADLLVTKKTLFLTGAGLSYAEIPNFAPLATEIKKHTTEEVILNPRIILDRFERWFDYFFTANPTKAHRAITNICRKIQCGVITGNFDMLQQKTGLIPFRIQGHLFQKYKEDFDRNGSKIELLFVVGMSHDIRGQIDEFRRKNPSLKILALLYDEKIPSYIQNEDYFLFGDANEILPKLYQEMISK